jgi:hypothetical protein
MVVMTRGAAEIAELERHRRRTLKSGQSAMAAAL